jgi:hypothetical protein
VHKFISVNTNKSLILIALVLCEVWVSTPGKSCCVGIIHIWLWWGEGEFEWRSQQIIMLQRNVSVCIRLFSCGIFSVKYFLSNPSSWFEEELNPQPIQTSFYHAVSSATSVCLCYYPETLNYEYQFICIRQISECHVADQCSAVSMKKICIICWRNLFFRSRKCCPVCQIEMVNKIVMHCGKEVIFCEIFLTVWLQKRNLLVHSPLM